MKCIHFIVFIIFFLLFPIQEYDNDAETLVSSLSINYDDDELDIGKYMCLVLFKWTIT